MALQARKLVFDGDTIIGRAVYARVYNALLAGWKTETVERMRDYLRVLDALQSVSDLRHISEEDRLQRQQADPNWEPNEHDRLLRPGPQTLLMADADFQRLKGAFVGFQQWPTEMARSVEATRIFLEAVPLVDIGEVDCAVPTDAHTRGVTSSTG